MKTSIIQVPYSLEVERTSRERQGENIYYTSTRSNESRKELAERGMIEIKLIAIPMSSCKHKIFALLTYSSNKMTDNVLV